MVEAILEAAARILESEGYLAASTNAIARRAGVSVGSLYQYFSSREDVFRTLAARHREGIHPLVRNALERLGDPAIAPEKVLSGLLADLLEAHARRPALMHALDSELGQIHTPEMLHAEQEGAAAATRLLAGRIPGPPESALASAWLAAEITATVSRKLAHDPPPWLDLDAAQAAFTRAMLALTRGIGR
jgi:AcrR family transcriptional regulator